ncbi:serine/threonine-protein kinase [Nocardia puris]|uniref:non-specific serine/threonine protein kinase n=1 Tax=Nocardia puris TaxID=208602 RepID=A0A366CYR1_9NOCA|nr:serine/threonine-protein kinase [Nocardia puris]RBO82951.1 serine/threonine-protein kinase [Nocardia puris]
MVSLSPGDEFAGYRIVRRIGGGGMGVVYLAEHPRLPRRDALKVLDAELAADAEFRARFEREAELAARLEHPNVVSIYDTGTEGDLLWISMRYVDGADGAQLLERGPLPPVRAVGIVAAAARGLDEAHRRGLLHRDVKPANILISRADDGSDAVRITDFGIARSMEASTSLTSTGGVLATFAYAAPEQLAGAPLDHRADVYSLGCTLYQFLTGSAPFTGRGPAAVMHAHLYEPPPRPSATVPGVPPGLDDVIARAMAKNPGARFGTCGELAAAAQRALAGGDGRRSGGQLIAGSGERAAGSASPEYPSAGHQAHGHPGGSSTGGHGVAGQGSGGPHAAGAQQRPGPPESPSTGGAPAGGWGAGGPRSGGPVAGSHSGPSTGQWATPGGYLPGGPAAGGQGSGGPARFGGPAAGAASFAAPPSGGFPAGAQLTGGLSPGMRQGGGFPAGAPLSGGQPSGGGVQRVAILVGAVAAVVALVITIAAVAVWLDDDGDVIATPTSENPSTTAQSTTAQSTTTPPTTTTSAAAAWGAAAYIVEAFPELLPADPEGTGYLGMRCGLNDDEGAWLHCPSDVDDGISVNIRCDPSGRRVGYSTDATGLAGTREERWTRPSGSGMVRWASDSIAGFGLLDVSFDDADRHFCVVSASGGRGGQDVYDRWWVGAPI